MAPIPPCEEGGTYSSLRGGWHLFQEFDPTFYALKVLSWVGLIWDVRTPPRRVLEAGTRQANVARLGYDQHAGLELDDHRFPQ